MTIEIGFVGAGWIAGVHLANLRAMEDVNLRAVADIDADRAAEKAKDWDAKVYDDCTEMINAESLDGVYVCVPPAAHGSIEAELADLGIPFFVEKPTHLDLALATQVAAMVREKELITCVGYQLRHIESVRAAREYLSNRQLTLAQGFYMGGLPPTSWWRQKVLSGGQVVEQSTHIYDLLRYLVGEVETVYAVGTTGAMVDVEGYDLEDASVAILEFSNGTIGHVVSTCVLKEGGQPDISLRFDGRGYTVKLTQNSLTIADSAEPQEQSFTESMSESIARGDKAFIQALRDGDGPQILSDYPDSLKTLALTFAVEESMASCEPVSPSELRLAAMR